MTNEITKHIKTFNDAHTEFTCKNSVSVSKCLNCIKEEFDEDAVAEQMVAKYFNTPGHKYYQKTKEDILKMWNDKREFSLNRGRMYDAMMEQLLEIRNPELFNLWKETIHFNNDLFLQHAYTGFLKLLKFLSSNGYVCIGTEILLFVRNKKNPQQIINGRCDCLMYSHTTGRYLIIDWKTNEEIKTRGFKQMLGPASIYPAADYYSYMTQLSFYKKALAETYKLADENHIDVLICQMGASENGYITYNPKFANYIYSSDFLDLIIEYAYLKLNIRDKIAESENKISNSLF